MHKFIPHFKVELVRSGLEVYLVKRTAKTAYLPVVIRNPNCLWYTSDKYRKKMPLSLFPFHNIHWNFYETTNISNHQTHNYKHRYYFTHTVYIFLESGTSEKHLKAQLYVDFPLRYLKVVIVRHIKSVIYRLSDNFKLTLYIKSANCNTTQNSHNIGVLVEKCL